MKPYKPEALVRISRYQNNFPTLPKDIQQDIYQRMTEMLEEEKAYCDKGNYEHIAQIVTSVAVYEVLQIITVSLLGLSLNNKHIILENHLDKI